VQTALQGTLRRLARAKVQLEPLAQGPLHCVTACWR
jgi:hypothetical protein